MVTDQLSRQLYMLKRKLASLEKILGVLQERVQTQQKTIRKLELELELDKLSARSKTHPFQAEEIDPFHGEEEMKQSKELEQVTDGEHALMPLQELIVKLQQKITEVNQGQQNETPLDEVGQLTTGEAGQAEAAKAVEEQAAEENKQPQAEEPKSSNFSAFDILGGMQKLLPLQELIIKLQQKIAEINQDPQKETQSNGAE